MNPRRQHRRAAPALLATAMLAAGVGMVAVGAPDAGAADTNKLSIRSGEYAYDLSGKPQPGWVEIDFDNPGSEMHMVVVFRLKPGVTAKQLSQAFQSDDEDAASKVFASENPVAGTPGVLSPGQSTATVTKLKAGRYGIVCFVPDPDGEPHFIHGMVDVFDVKGSKSTLRPPKDGTVGVTVTDTAIELPASGLPRSAWVKVVNKSSAPRDLTLAKYEGGATFEEADAAYKAFFETGRFPSGSAPASLRGGIGGLLPGGVGYFREKADAGSWVVVSSDVDSDDNTGQLHTDFTVK